jgi:hypothetical protein
MCYCQDSKGVPLNAVNEPKGKAVEGEPPPVFIKRLADFREFAQECHNPCDFLKEFLAQTSRALFTNLHRSGQFLFGLSMKARDHFFSVERRRANTSSAGIKSTSP